MEWYWCRDWDCVATWFWSPGAAAWAQVVATLLAMWATYKIANKAHNREMRAKEKEMKFELEKRARDNRSALVRLLASLMAIQRAVEHIDEARRRNQIRSALKFAGHYAESLKYHHQIIQDAAKGAFANPGVLSFCFGAEQKAAAVLEYMTGVGKSGFQADAAAALGHFSRDLSMDVESLSRQMDELVNDPESDFVR